jgi:ADP-ribosylglycohydrolase
VRDEVKSEMRDRGAGALYGLVLGDALGMPTQMVPREQIVARYGAVLTGTTFDRVTGWPLR